MSRFGSSALAALLLLAGPAWADEDASTSFSHRMAQGRFLLDGGQPSQAMAEFARAAEMEAGRGEPEVHHFLARAAWQAGELAIAMDAIRRAKALSGQRADPEFAALHEFLTTRFGKVLVIGGSNEDARTPEPAVPLLDPELKRVFEIALAEMAAPTSGSTSVYLPIGAYRVGSHLVEVTAASTTTMDLRPSIGATASGVYGESTAPRRPVERTPPPPVNLSHRAMIGGAGAGYAQQGGGAGALRVLIGWEPWFEERLGLRIAVGVGALRLERIQGDLAEPAGFLVEGQIAGGPLLPLPDGGAMGPWLSWQVGWGRPIDQSLPDSYRGPAAYAVHGPDLALRIVFPRAGAAQGAIELGAMVREFYPLNPPRDSDQKPHLAAGAGGSFSVLLGGAP